MNGIKQKLGEKIVNEQSLPSLLSKSLNFDFQDMFCNSSTDGARCENTWCQCIHKLTVKKNDLVEMVVLSESPGSGFTHPVHLHGYIFRVVAYDRVR